ncbi:hypothetical protein HDK64DRAFT_260048 [Phyllosticta capitalensis]
MWYSSPSAPHIAITLFFSPLILASPSLGHHTPAISPRFGFDLKSHSRAQKRRSRTVRLSVHRYGPGVAGRSGQAREAKLALHLHRTSHLVSSHILDPLSALLPSCECARAPPNRTGSRDAKRTAKLTILGSRDADVPFVDG